MSPPVDEPARLEALFRYDLSGSNVDCQLDEIAATAAAACGVPIAQIGFLGQDRLRIRSTFGLAGTSVPRRGSFSACAICLHEDVFEVPDTRQDVRFAHHPLVAHEPSIRFFAAAPIVEPTGHAVGTLVVMDYEVRNLSEAERSVLRLLARQIVALLELRQTVHRMEGELAERVLFEHRHLEERRHLRATNVLLDRASATDALTRLANRRSFEERLTEEVQRMHRLLYPLALFIVDVDNFKQINDTFGHPTGDQVLRKVAQALKRACRETDFVARLGGDEFAVLLPGTDLQGARIIAERCRVAIENLAWSERTVHVSIGVAQLPSNARDGSTLVDDADQALLCAKRSGKNQSAAARSQPETLAS
jgi:diguanylate cyclase (GGDEF)-like protein